MTPWILFLLSLSLVSARQGSLYVIGNDTKGIFLQDFAFSPNIGAPAHKQYIAGLDVGAQLSQCSSSGVASAGPCIAYDRKLNWLYFGVNQRLCRVQVGDSPRAFLSPWFSGNIVDLAFDDESQQLYFSNGTQRGPNMQAYSAVGFARPKYVPTVSFLDKDLFTGVIGTFQGQFAFVTTPGRYAPSTININKRKVVIGGPRGTNTVTSLLPSVKYPDRLYFSVSSTLSQGSSSVGYVNDKGYVLVSEVNDAQSLIAEDPSSGVLIWLSEYKGITMWRPLGLDTETLAAEKNAANYYSRGLIIPGDCVGDCYGNGECTGQSGVCKCAPFGFGLNCPMFCQEKTCGDHGQCSGTQDASLKSGCLCDPLHSGDRCDGWAIPTDYTVTLKNSSLPGKTLTISVSGMPNRAWSYSTVGAVNGVTVTVNFPTEYRFSSRLPGCSQQSVADKFPFAIPDDYELVGTLSCNTFNGEKQCAKISFGNSTMLWAMDDDTQLYFPVTVSAPDYELTVLSFSNSSEVQAPPRSGCFRPFKISQLNSFNASNVTTTGGDALINSYAFSVEQQATNSVSEKPAGTYRVINRYDLGVTYTLTPDGQCTQEILGAALSPLFEGEKLYLRELTNNSCEIWGSVTANSTALVCYDDTNPRFSNARVDSIDNLRFGTFMPSDSSDPFQVPASCKQYNK